MPNPIYPERKLYIDGVDTSSRIASPFEGQTGIFSYKDTERLSSVGILKFSIDNSDEAYSNSANLIGKEVSITLTVDTREKQIFFGYITEATVDSGEWGRRSVEIYAADWMHIANKTRVQNVELATFITADEAIPTLLALTENQPADTDLEIGTETFENMFDGALQKTTVYSELDKITKSELGYLYLRFRETELGETLRLEDSLYRGSTRPLRRVPKDVGTSFLKYHGNAGATGYLKNSTGGFIKLALAQDAYFDRSMVDSRWEIGQNVVNQFSVTQIPRDTDSVDVVLFTLDSPIELGTTEKQVISGQFTDPNKGTVIQAFDLVTPVATTDYLFNSAEDGSGANLTANLATLLTSWGANGFVWTFKNNGPPGYLTFFQVRGKGIYKYNPIETLFENEESIDTLVKTEKPDSISREYSSDYNTSLNFAKSVVAVNRSPIKVMKEVSFVANTSEHLMLAFMYLDIGDKIQIVESNPSHTGNYYIQGIKFRVDVNGIVYFTWYLKEAVETICQPISVHAPTDNAGVRMAAIDFGILPQLANLPEYSYSFWIKRTSPLHGSFGPVIGRSVDDGSGRRGNYLFIIVEKFLFTSFKSPDDGTWESGDIISSVDVWEHVVLTYNNSLDSANPEIWLNGVSKTVTETGIPSGTTDDDSDCPLILFNIGPTPGSGDEYDYDTIDHFALKDVRVYNRILTSGEINELLNFEIRKS